MQEKEDICIYVEDDQQLAWLASSWPIVFTGQLHRREQLMIV
jgi:hypothetical protein